jgi:hypothetical protein
MSYNGFTNYETWILMNDIFNDIDFSSYDTVTPEMCEEIANDVIFDNQQVTGVALTLVNAALFVVDWWEISELINNSK